MDEHTVKAKKWLDKRYRRDEKGGYFSHQPIFGLQTDRSEPNPILRLARSYRILSMLAQLDFDHFIDIGGGEGYHAGYVSDLYGVPAYSSDLSSEACQRAIEIFGIQSISTDAAVLPFKDQSFDVVLFSEVIEHLSNPVNAISECYRIAKKYLILTTAEFCPTGELERALRLYTLDQDYPHAERNWFTSGDFKTLLGEEILLSSQFRNYGGTTLDYFDKTPLDRRTAERALYALTASHRLDPDHDGVIVVYARPGYRLDEQVFSMPEMDGEKAKYLASRLIEPPSEGLFNRSPAPQKLDLLLNALRCPACHADLQMVGKHLVCGEMGHEYPVENGVPVMLPIHGFAGKNEPPDILAPGDPDRGRKIRMLMRKLHGKRPVCNDRIRPALAAKLLRVVWFVKRPETVSQKINRIYRRLLRQPRLDAEQLSKQIS